MKKKGLVMSLEFLIGLIFTVILLLAAFAFINKLLFPTGPEKHTIDAWAADIKLTEDERVTELIPIQDNLKHILFIFFSTDSREATVLTQDGDESVARKSGRGARICSYNRIRDRVTYCSNVDINYVLYNNQRPGNIIITNDVNYLSKRLGDRLGEITFKDSEIPDVMIEMKYETEQGERNIYFIYDKEWRFSQNKVNFNPIKGSYFEDRDITKNLIPSLRDINLLAGMSFSQGYAHLKQKENIPHTAINIYYKDQDIVKEDKHYNYDPKSTNVLKIRIPIIHKFRGDMTICEERDGC